MLLFFTVVIALKVAAGAETNPDFVDPNASFEPVPPYDRMALWQMMLWRMQTPSLNLAFPFLC